MAIVLMKSAAASAVRVRVNCDCDDIGNLPFLDRDYCAARCIVLIKERANPGKLPKITV